MQKINFLQASSNPIEDLKTVTYEGQPENKRRYRSGYEAFMSLLPSPDNNDATSQALAFGAMSKLAEKLVGEDWIREQTPDGDFIRTILAMEAPRVMEDGAIKEGAEMIVAQWGKGYQSPVHGHKAGLIYEHLLSGKMLVNLYRIVDATRRIVRPISSTIFSGDTQLLSTFGEGLGGVRDAVVHNFTVLEPSTSVHYVPEHTRDGRDNRFEVEYFDDVHPLSASDVERISATEGIYLRKGDVALVDSSNVADYGYHYIVITGAPILKAHGLRPQEISIAAPNNKLVWQYERHQGLTLLKLKPEAAKAFREFHGISIENGEVVFPNAK